MKIISEQILQKTKYLVFKTLTYLDQKGNMNKWDMVSRVNSQPAVVIVPFYGNDIIVIKEFRVPINSYEYGFPAGLIDEGETVEQAAIRELKEETGLDIIDIFATSPSVYSSTGITDEAVNIVYAKVGGNISKSRLGDSEDISVLKLSKQQAKKLLEDKNKKFGAKAWIILHNFVNANHFEY